MGTWKSKNRHKYLLQYHIIFVCKYRKKLLVSRQISDDIKQFSYEICQRHSVIIRYMEKISSKFTKTILERTYLLDRWIFCLQRRKCIRRNAKKVYRRPRLRRWQQMLKAYKYRIYPTNEQKEQIAKTFGCCRFVYNRTLAYRKEAYEKEKKT